MTNAQIEQRLAELPRAVAWPEPVDVTTRVVEAIVPRTARGATPRRRSPLWRVGRPALAAGVLIVVTAVALIVSPGARHAVATWLGIPGIDLRLRDDVTVPVPAELRLGESVALTEAQQQVDFPIRTLQLENATSTAGEVFIDNRTADGVVHVVYPAGAGLPEGTYDGIGAILTQFRTPAGDPAFTKEAMMSGNAVVPVTVGGEFAIWTSGASHVLIPNRGGVPVRDEARLSENALLWSGGGVTYRLETSLPMEDAIAVAETVR